ncbi:unnamed protein product [Phyllotreta striolata]|uniref:Odorant receptor n=1 Tax=Phyllotreta striolata TaxID=444603 RepID=A0A9N9THI2_PHYSR|nr:unnamed protein product [Phyllotreta striolata]
MLIYDLRKNLKILNRRFKVPADYDEDYQKQISLILKSCAKQHAYLQQFMDKNINNHDFMNFVGTLLFVTASFTAISMIYIVMNRLRPKYDIPLVLLSVLIVIAYLLYCHYGQTLMNECEFFYDALYSTPWIYWNKENRNLLLTILTLARKPLAVQFYGIMYVNYSMILSAVRLCYSIFTIAHKL